MEKKSSEQPIFSLLHATRGRPRPMVECAGWWRSSHSKVAPGSKIDSGANPYEYILSVDSDDATLVEVFGRGWHLIDGLDVVTGVPAGNVAAYNRAASVAKGKILIQVMDDVQPPLEWDRQILDLVRDPDDVWVLGVGDGGYGTQKKICTVLICSRAWYEQCGYLYYPGYYSMYADDDVTEHARAKGCLIEAWDKICFPHHWGMWGHDEVWRTTNDDKWRRQGAGLLRKRRANGFGPVR